MFFHKIEKSVAIIKRGDARNIFAQKGFLETIFHFFLRSFSEIQFKFKSLNQKEFNLNLQKFC